LADTTRQDKARRNKIKGDKTRQEKTRHDRQTDKLHCYNQSFNDGLQYKCFRCMTHLRKQWWLNSKNVRQILTEDLNSRTA